jgi:hypothetical protein
MSDKNEEKDSLQELIPQANQVEVQPYGRAEPETLTIYPFTLGQLPKVLRHIYALLRFVSADGQFDAKEMFMLGGEDVLMCLAVAAGKSREWFDKLPLDQGIELLAVVISENQDFFVNHVMPHLATLTERFKAATNQMTQAAGTGQTS